MQKTFYTLSLLLLSSLNYLNSQKLDSNYGINGKQAFHVRDSYLGVTNALMQNEKLRLYKPS